MQRRTMLKQALAALVAGRGARGSEAIAARPITKGPKFHWYGYYDKLEFDPENRYVLGLEVDFEDRVPGPNDVVTVGMVDLKDNDRWIELGQSRAWSWQQGSMLQWLPGSASEILYNDREGDQFVARILDVKTGKRRTLPSSIYTISDDGAWGLTTDFPRLRPETRYAPAREIDLGTAPADSGIWRVDMKTGARKLIISFEDVLKISSPHCRWGRYLLHWMSHMQIAPDGSRFVFVHRWRDKDDRQILCTRFFSANPDGSDLFLSSQILSASHYAWRDSRTLLVWSWNPSHGEKFYLWEDKTDRISVFAPEVMTRNGHVTYLRENRWILSDTYPDRDRNQHLYLYNVQTGLAHSLGRYYTPPNYTGPVRCDLHPRASRDGRLVVFDSPHGGNGRQMYLVDISGIVG